MDPTMVATSLGWDHLNSGMFCTRVLPAQVGTHRVRLKFAIRKNAILLVVCSQRSSAFLRHLFGLALFVLAREEVHLTRRSCLIAIPDPECVGGGVERACAVPWLPAGRV